VANVKFSQGAENIISESKLFILRTFALDRAKRWRTRQQATAIELFVILVLDIEEINEKCRLNILETVWQS